MKKQVLVTGGAGYIGSAIVADLVAAGHSVVVFDDLSTGKREKLPAEAELHVGDMTDETALGEIFSTHKFDAVIHCAAKKAVGESEQEPAFYFKNNVGGTLNLLTQMTAHHVPHIIFSSTAAVYAPPVDGIAPVTENDTVNPASVYGQSKVLAETLIREFHRTGKLAQYTILRYFNVAGDAGLHYREEQAQNIFPLIAKALASNSTFYIFGEDWPTEDGTGVRDYIHVRDLAEAHRLALDSTDSSVYNLGTGTGYSVKELIAAFEAQSGRTLQAVVVPRRAGDVAVTVANADKAKQVLGWEPRSTLEDMVKSTILVYGL
jgi:UDP-glucose 4-epimerase